jgi:hypothetical protein
MEQTPNPKCGRCYNYWKPDETDIKTSGLPYKTCKKCRNGNIKYRQENIDRINQQRRNYYQENADKINERTRNYYQENADKIKDLKKNYYQENIDTIRERETKYRRENADKIKELRKKYRRENADKLKELRKKYRQENKCEHLKGQGECSICNLSLYLIKLQRRSISRCLKLSTQNKTKSSIEYLGCDVDYFKDYIQKKMDIYNQTEEVKMDFTNIHIDHIKPVSVFNLDDEEDFLDCCNYTNLQPLLINDNLNKSNKWTDENEEYWNNNIKGKEHLELYI